MIYFLQPGSIFRKYQTFLNSTKQQLKTKSSNARACGGHSAFTLQYERDFHPPPTASTQNSLELRSVCAFTIYTSFSPFFLVFLFENLITEGATYASWYTREDQRITSLLLLLCGLLPLYGLQGWNLGWQAYTGTGLLSGLSVWPLLLPFSTCYSRFCSGITFSPVCLFLSLVCCNAPFSVVSFTCISAHLSTPWFAVCTCLRIGKSLPPCRPARES